MLLEAFRKTLRELAYARTSGMKAEIWLARCAAELEHLQLTHSRDPIKHTSSTDSTLHMAGELIEAQRYRGLDPVQAARIYWRESVSSPRP